MDIATKSNYDEADGYVLEDNMRILAEWYSKLTNMMENRLHDPMFTEIVNYISNIEQGKIAYLSEEDQERQLRFCSQWKFTFGQLFSEMTFYYERIERNYKIWLAKKSILAKEKILDEQRADIVAGIRTKSKFGEVTKEEVRNHVLVDNAEKYKEWHSYLEKSARIKAFLNNLLEDIKHRSIILMSLRKDKLQY